MSQLELAKRRLKRPWRGVSRGFLVGWISVLLLGSMGWASGDRRRDLLSQEAKLFAVQWQSVLTDAGVAAQWDIQAVRKSPLFSLIQSFARRSDEGSRQAYLVNSKGQILWASHEKPAWELDQFSSLRHRFLELVNSSSHGSLVQPSSSGLLSDSGPETHHKGAHLLAFERVSRSQGEGGLDVFSVVLERRVGSEMPAISSGFSWVGVSIGFGLGILLGASGVFLGMGYSRRRSRSSSQQDSFRGKDEPPSLIPVALGSASERSGPLVGGVMGTPTGATVAGPPVFSSEVRRLRDQLNHWETEDELVEAFESRVFAGRSPREVASDLVNVIQKLSGGPCLYFSHQPQIGALVLEATAGLRTPPESGTVKVPVSVTLLDQVQGRVPMDDPSRHHSFELQPDPALADSVLHHFGVGHFEAWALPFYSALGRHAQRASLIGIVILLDSGTDSLSQKKRMSRMIRTAGLVVENSLLSI